MQYFWLAPYGCRIKKTCFAKDIASTLLLVAGLSGVRPPYLTTHASPSGSRVNFFLGQRAGFFACYEVVPPLSAHKKSVCRPRRPCRSVTVFVHCGLVPRTSVNKNRASPGRPRGVTGVYAIRIVIFEIKNGFCAKGARFLSELTKMIKCLRFLGSLFICTTAAGKAQKTLSFLRIDCFFNSWLIWFCFSSQKLLLRLGKTAFFNIVIKKSYYHYQNFAFIYG